MRVTLLMTVTMPFTNFTEALKNCKNVAKIQM